MLILELKTTVVKIKIPVVFLTAYKNQLERQSVVWKIDQKKYPAYTTESKKDQKCRKEHKIHLKE